MMRILADTSFLVSLVNSRERQHGECADLAASLTQQIVVPVTVLPETAYLLHSRMGHGVMRAFLQQMAQPAWEIEALGENDLVRAVELLHQYGDNDIDFVDTTLIAIAERLNIDTILTLDHRHFFVVRPRHTSHFNLLP